MTLRGTREGDLVQLEFREQCRAKMVRREVAPKQVVEEEIADFDAEVHVFDGDGWRFWGAGWLEDQIEIEVRFLDEDDPQARRRRRAKRPREEIRTVVREGMRNVADRLRRERRFVDVHVMMRVRPRRPSRESPTVSELYERSGGHLPRYAHRPRRAEPVRSRVLTQARARRVARQLNRRRMRRIVRSDARR